MSFREIDISGFEPGILRDQSAPTLVWVDLADLVIDERYQRSLTRPGRRAIQRIGSDWDWTKYQPILVAATADGRMAVVDGQHRAHGAAVAGLRALPAMVVPMTPAQQAAAFAAVNTDRIKLRAENVFKARLAAGDPLAVEAEAVVAMAGCRLMTYNPSAANRRPGEVFCHALILSMVDRGEAAAVTAGLAAVRESQQGRVDRSDIDSRGFALRVYDGVVLNVWLPVLARSQRFLSLPLADLFDEIEWDEMKSWATRQQRVRGGTVRAIMSERVEEILRQALNARDAAKSPRMQAVGA